MPLHRHGLALRLDLLVLVASIVLTAPLAADPGVWEPIGPDGGWVRALAAAPSRPATLYAWAEKRGIFRSTDRGQSWTLPGGALRERRVFDLEVDPASPVTVYAGTEAGLLRSTDGGVSWAPAGPAPPVPEAVQLVKVHPRNPRLLFAVSGQTLQRSADRGATWITRSGWPESVKALAFVAGRPDVLYAGTETGGVWKSTDTGATWVRVSREPLYLTALAVDPHNPKTLYAGSRGIVSLDTLLKSTDGGATWAPSQQGIELNGNALFVSSLALDPADPATLYVEATGFVFRSRNRGATWARVGTGLRGSVGPLEALPYGLLAATTVGIFRSTDRGATWHTAQGGLSASMITELAVDRRDPPRIYAVTPDGLFRTPDRGVAWTRLPARGISRFLPHTLAIDPDEPETLYTGDMESVAKSTDGGRQWTRISGIFCVVPARIAIDPRTPSTLYAAGFLATPICRPHPACYFARSLDAGGSWQCLAAPGFLQGVDPFTSAVYAAAADFSRSTDQGTTWSALLPGPGADVSAFATSPLVPGTLWTGRQGAVARSRDGGVTWDSFASGLPDEPIVELATDPADPAVLYAASRTQGVFRSNDAGETWTLVAAWPAGVQVQGRLLVDPVDRSILYVGTDVAGVLRLRQED